MFKLRNESLFVLAQASGGFYNSDQLKLIATEAEKGSALLKLTEDGSIGLIIEPERLESLEATFQSQGLLLKHYRSQQIPTPRACLGELCPEHELDALGHAIESATALQAAFPDGAPALRIGINGCAQNCLASGTDDIHIVGESTGYKIQIGGKASELPQIGQFYAENVAPEQLGKTLVHLIGIYLSHREENESFHDLVERIGLSAFEMGAPVLDLPESADSDDLNTEMSAELLDGVDDALADPLALGEMDGASSPDIDQFTDLDPNGLGSPSEVGSALGEEDLGSLTHPHEVDDSLALSHLELEQKDDASTSTESDFGFEMAHPDDLLKALDGGELNDVDSSIADRDHSADDDALVESLESQNEMMAEEDSLESEEATEDDVVRVTLAMRSESSFEAQDDGSAPFASEPPDELALAAGAIHDYGTTEDDQTNSIQQNEHDNTISDIDTPAFEAASEAPLSESGMDGDVSDISPKFLQLQEQAKHQGSLQIRLVEDILSVLTPDGARINLPFSALEQGLKVVMSLGSFRFESSVKDNMIFLRYADATLSLPLDQIVRIPQKNAA